MFPAKTYTGATSITFGRETMFADSESYLLELAVLCQSQLMCVKNSPTNALSCFSRKKTMVCQEWGSKVHF